MRADITSLPTPGGSGWQVFVHLELSDEEHNLVYENRMSLSDEGTLEIAKHDGETLYFGSFYDRTHTTVWEFNGSYQAGRFIDQLNRTLNGNAKQPGSMNWFFAQNRKHPGHEKQVPWNFFEPKRFEHVHMVAGTGSGKTTFLSALIKADLDKVARGQASVVVIDSQSDRLSWDLPRLARFAPGGDLAGRLIYLRPDLEHPLALNIFDFKGYAEASPNDQYRMRSTAADILQFFMGAIVDAPSNFMKNVLENALQAVALIPDATVHTLQALLAPGGMARLVIEYPILKTLDETTQRFLDTRMERDYKASLPALRDRLDGITSNPFLAKSFAQSENKLPLYDILSRPHVIVVNPDKLLITDDETIGLIGRYVLASLLGVVRKRRDGGLPVYMFFDEAQQYIEKEESVVKLINEARRQKISLTVAYHETSDIKLESVKAALNRAQVQIRPKHQDYSWYVTLRGGQQTEVKPPDIDFKRGPHMSDKQWQTIVADMHNRFSVEHPKTSRNAPEQTKNISVELPPEDDASVHR